MLCVARTFRLTLAVVLLHATVALLSAVPRNSSMETVLELEETAPPLFDNTTTPLLDDNATPLLDDKATPLLDDNATLLASTAAPPDNTGATPLDIPIATPSNSSQPPLEAMLLERSSENGTSGQELPSSTPSEDARHAMTYDYLYKEGVKHYLDNDWHQCARYMELAIKDHHWYIETLYSCRKGCRTEADEATPLGLVRTTEQIFFETTLRGALCLLKCRKEKFGKRQSHVAPVDVDRDFESRKTYDYLQLCYFKLGKFQDAANAAVTVLARQPDHTIMANNLKQYVDDYSVDQDLLENVEMQEYAKEYVKGDHAHIEEDYEQSIVFMEKALILYWEALDQCRLLCDEPFDQGWFPDFVSSVANHYTFTFRCKRRCPAKLSNLYGEEISNFLPSIFNYLQFAYHKENNLPAACGAVESFLELAPTDADMLRNKQFYHSEYQKLQRHFVPRPEVVVHAARERYEEALIHFIDTEFVFLDEKKQEQLPAEPPKTTSSSIGEKLADMLKNVFNISPSVLDVDGKGEL